MKQKDDHDDQPKSNARSTGEIKRSKKRSTRSQNPEKFSTGPLNLSRVGVLNLSRVGVLNLSRVSETGVLNLSRVSETGVLNLSTPEKKGYIKIYKNLFQKMRLEIKSYSAYVVYEYLYEKAFEWVHDDSIKASLNIELTNIMDECYMASCVVRRALQYLEKIGWISIEKRPGISSIYIVYRPKPDIPSKGDHDLLKNHDLNNDLDNHLQKEISDDSLSIIKQIYEELTKNTWTNKDTENHNKLPNSLKAEDVVRYMRAINERIKKPIGSFAYFLKAISRVKGHKRHKSSTEMIMSC